MEQVELDRLAYAGAELPDGLGYAGTLYFLMLRALYQFAKATGMDTERGRKEKQKIEETVRTFRANQRLMARQAEDRTKTSAARSDYRKARNAMGGVTALYLPPDVVAALNAADRMVEALDNIPIERTENAKPNIEG